MDERLDVSTKKTKKDRLRKETCLIILTEDIISISCSWNAMTLSFFCPINRLILSTNLCNPGCEVCLYLTKIEKAVRCFSLFDLLLTHKKSIMDFSWANRLDKREKEETKARKTDWSSYARMENRFFFESVI